VSAMGLRLHLSLEPIGTSALGIQTKFARSVKAKPLCDLPMGRGRTGSGRVSPL